MKTGHEFERDKEVHLGAFEGKREKGKMMELYLNLKN